MAYRSRERSRRECCQCIYNVSLTLDYLKKCQAHAHVEPNLLQDAPKSSCETLLSLKISGLKHFVWLSTLRTDHLQQLLSLKSLHLKRFTALGLTSAVNTLGAAESTLHIPPHQAHNLIN
jgi:hypothetical protein